MKHIHLTTQEIRVIIDRINSVDNVPEVDRYLVGALTQAARSGTSLHLDNYEFRVLKSFVNDNNLEGIKDIFNVM